jgi:RNA polymerase sigma-70 factor, ECF subfamily
VLTFARAEPTLSEAEKNARARLVRISQKSETLSTPRSSNQRPHDSTKITQRMSNTSRATRYSSLSLKDVVCLCAGPGDDEAWEEFVSRVGRPISLTIMRTASLWGESSRALVEDLVQVTYLKLWEDGCRLLRDFAIQHPEAILGYLKKTAANATHDYFKHGHSQSSGGNQPHVSTSDVDPEAGKEVHGSQETMAFGVFLQEIDEHLKRGLTGADQERDRMIFWLYFRQGMSTKEIASLPSVGLGAKGVGSVIERLKHCVREQILGIRSDSDEEQEQSRKEIPLGTRIG